MTRMKRFGSRKNTATGFGVMSLGAATAGRGKLLEGGRMHRSLGFAVALALSAPALLSPVLTAHADDRALPMRFDLRLQGPAESCGTKCAIWISASGAITADSARDFKQFMQSRERNGGDLRDATVVLDSDGGSVHGAIALGREIRAFALATTVGRTVDLSGKDDKPGNKDAVLSPRGDCESMCAFVLLGGVQRIVPPQARVMVHQIWLGDRREDPTAATYSAEDLVLVQRDIGRLAQYTADMGGAIDLLDLALRIPPWEPLHTMTREEIRRTRLATADPTPSQPETVAALPPMAEQPPGQPMTDGARATPIDERRWAMVDRAGAASLARRQPLTVEGDLIGTFDLAVSCGAGGDSFDLSYLEHRHASDAMPLPDKLSAVGLEIGRTRVKLKVAASKRSGNPDELVSYANGSVPAASIQAFTAAGNRSMTVETEAKGMVTVIRIGNTGALKNLPRLLEGCAVKPLGERADAAPVRKTGGMAGER
jgi:hypothetical protein